MSSRNSILERIRAIQLEEKPLPAPLPDQIQVYEDKVKQFMLSCTATGTGVYTFRDHTEAIAFVHEKAGADRLLIGQGLNGNEQMTDPATAVHAVLKGYFGVAENNAIWLPESNMPHRMIPFVCEHLYLVIEAKDIVSDMHEAYHRTEIFEQGFGVFIAGPSKTADIEQSLVIGAHGPLSLDVLLIGN